MRRRRREATTAPNALSTTEALRCSAILVTLAAEVNASGGNPGEGLVATLVECLAPIGADRDLAEMVMLNLAGRVAMDVAMEAERLGISFSELWTSEARAIAAAVVP
jgi:hypothetical protein